MAFALTNPTKNLEMLLNSMETFQASFTQITKDDTGKVIQKAKGTVALKRSGKFRWITNIPAKQIIVADGKELWIYDPELEQASVQSLKASIHQSPAILISEANVNLSSDFYVVTEKDKKSHLWYVLTPKTKESTGYSLVKLYFQDKQLNTIKILNNLDQWNTLIFTGIKTNRFLSKDSFIFHPPKNVDIIDNINKGTYSYAQ